MASFVQVRCAFLSGVFLAAVLGGCTADKSYINVGGVASAAAGGVTTGTNPIISGNPAESILIGMPYNFRPTATAGGGATLSFSIRNQPNWAKFDPMTGALSGRPTAADVGNYAQIQITASNGFARSALAPFSINVLESAPGAVTISWMPPTFNTDGATAVDLAGYHIYYGASSTELTNVVSIDNVGLSAYVISNLTRGTWYFAVTAYSKAKMESSLSAIVPVSI